jgi:hypothetical protein
MVTETGEEAHARGGDLVRHRRDPGGVAVFALACAAALVLGTRLLIPGVLHLPGGR